MEPADPTRVRLSSWKDIAAFFDRDVRTVQRWEKLEGLPVHRHRHQNQHSVYAFPEELEAWWHQRDLTGEPAESEAESDPSQATAGAVDPVAPTIQAIDPVVAPMPRVGRRMKLALACGTIALVGLAGGLRFVWPTHVDRAAIVATFEGTHTGGFATGPVGDLNGDGRADVTFSSDAAGEAYVLLSSVTGRRPRAPDAADVTISTSLHAQLTAAQIADFDGDGLNDLLLHTALYEPETFHATGPTFLVRGRKSWPRTLLVPEDADVTIRPDLPKDIRLASCTSAPFDLNGDGISDVLVGGADHSPDGSRMSAGGVFILFGRRNWPRVVDPIAAADITFEGSRTGEGLLPHCAVSDLDRDGRLDVALIAGESTLWNKLGGRGRAYVWYGGDAWPKILRADEADLQIASPVDPSDGAMVIAADVNGDGASDLITGWTTRTAAPAQVAISFGGSRKLGALTPDQMDVRIVSREGPSHFGQALDALDLDGDGRADLLLSTPEAGRVYVVFGRESWPRRAVLEELAGSPLFTADPRAGVTGVHSADLDGDSLLELTLSSDTARTPSGRTGRFWVLRPYLSIPIDVRPTGAPNILYYPRGVLVVRVPGRGPVNADQIDPGTLRLAGVAAESSLLRDFDGDGVPEMQVYFETGRMQVTPATTSVVLTARTKDGRMVAGRDSVVVISSDAARPAVPSAPGGPSF